MIVCSVPLLRASEYESYLPTHPVTDRVINMSKTKDWHLGKADLRKIEARDIATGFGSSHVEAGDGRGGGGGGGKEKGHEKSRLATLRFMFK